MTQNETVLAHLRHGPITPLVALREHGIMRLGARIWDLRRMGYRIDRRIVVSPVNPRKHYAEYRLAPKGKFEGFG